MSTKRRKFTDEFKADAVQWLFPDAFAFDLNRPIPAPPALSPPGGVGIVGTLVAALRMPGWTRAATLGPRRGSGTARP